MENKRYLKIFNSQSDYETQKDAVMGIPHVVLIEDTNEVIFASENETVENLIVENYDDYIVIVNTVDVIEGNLFLNGDNIISEEENKQFKLIIE